MFLPVLENAVKAQKLRSTLGIFEKSKFLFNLPGQLMESINTVSICFPLSSICRENGAALTYRANTSRRFVTTRRAPFSNLPSLVNTFRE